MTQEYSKIRRSPIHEVDKIQNEFWWNVSATPFGPISQEFGAEHNLTYEFVVPQQDWLNRTVRLQYVEDNGTTSDEFPLILRLLKVLQDHKQALCYLIKYREKAGSPLVLLSPGISSLCFQIHQISWRS